MPEITLGEPVCDKLKIIYFPDTTWQACYKDVAKRFSELNIKMSKFYPDKSSVDILQELTRFSVNDIKDVLEII